MATNNRVFERGERRGRLSPLDRKISQTKKITTKQKRTAESERSLAEEIEARRDDTSKRIALRPPEHKGDGGTVFSLRLSVDELEQLREAAESAGVSVSEWVRKKLFAKSDYVLNSTGSYFFTTSMLISGSGMYAPSATKTKFEMPIEGDFKPTFNGAVSPFSKTRVDEDALVF